MLNVATRITIQEWLPSRPHWLGSGWDYSTFVTTETIDVGLMLSESLAAKLASLVTRSMGSHSDSGRPHD